METDRIKWNERYGGEDFWFSLGPSGFLAQSLEQVCARITGRRALDVACGEGRNAIFLAQNGFRVDAVDIAERGLERGIRRVRQLGVQVDFIRADLEEYRLQEDYDLILNFNFLLRPLIPELIEHLVPGGMIVMETILSAPTLPGAHTREFLLQPGELERLFSAFGGSILQLEEDLSQETPVARILFRKELPDAG